MKATMAKRRRARDPARVAVSAEGGGVPSGIEAKRTSAT